jgi:hypothetical protein
VLPIRIGNAESADSRSLSASSRRSAGASALSRTQGYAAVCKVDVSAAESVARQSDRPGTCSGRCRLRRARARRPLVRSHRPTRPRAWSCRSRRAPRPGSACYPPRGLHRGARLIAGGGRFAAGTVAGRASSPGWARARINYTGAHLHRAPRRGLGGLRAPSRARGAQLWIGTSFLITWNWQASAPWWPGTGIRQTSPTGRSRE